MKINTCSFVAVLLCTAYGNPLSQTVCETQAIPGLLPGLLPPSIGPSGYPYSLTLGALAQPTVVETASIPSYMSIPVVQPSTTVCETKPNPALPVQPYGYGVDPAAYTWPYNLGKTTVCETSPTIPAGVPRYLPAFDYGVAPTVYETSHGLPILPYPMMFPRHGHTTVCESTPNTLPPYVPFL